MNQGTLPNAARAREAGVTPHQLAAPFGRGLCAAAVTAKSSTRGTPILEIDQCS